MASTPVLFSILRQLDATLQLVVTLSRNLNRDEILEIRRGLARAFSSIETILEERITGVNSVCEFGINFLDVLFIFFR